MTEYIGTYSKDIGGGQKDLFCKGCNEYIGVAGPRPSRHTPAECLENIGPALRVLRKARCKCGSDA